MEEHRRRSDRLQSVDSGDDKSATPWILYISGPTAKRLLKKAVPVIVGVLLGGGGVGIYAINHNSGQGHMGLVWYYEVSNSLVRLWGRRTHAGSPTS
jgi:hypothetical protein